jgi:hypothetical protein
MKVALPLALAFAFVAVVPASAQDMTFDWRPANSEEVQLDPGYYHAGHVYRPGSNGGNMHVDIESEKPVTVALVPEAQWNSAAQRSEHLDEVNFLCRQEHVVKTTYICHIPPQPMVLVIRDERNNPDRVVLAGVRAVRTGDRSVDRVIATGVSSVFTGSGSVAHRYVSPNDLHIQYYSWVCINNCDQPEFRWYQKAKEKYQLTPILKVYGGIFPDHDGEQISVKIKSPVPMAVAVLPSSVANQLNLKPETLQQALANSSCQQRGVQSLTWECPLRRADGPLSVVVVPESTAKVPHKKAEIEVYETKCVAHCAVPASDNSDQ